MYKGLKYLSQDFSHTICDRTPARYNGPKGVPVLWIFGNPYNLEAVQLVGYLVLDIPFPMLVSLLILLSDNISLAFICRVCMDFPVSQLCQ